MILIGFSGKKRHGKDTAADAIIKARGKQADTAYHHIPFLNWLTPDIWDIRKFGFGDLVRDELAYHRPNSTDRRIQQHWGQSKREIYLDYWTLKMDAIVLRAKPEVALITGIRFENELEWLRSYGGYLIHVYRSGFDDPEPGTNDITERFDGKGADITISVKDGQTKELADLAVCAFDTLMQTEKEKF